MSYINVHKVEIEPEADGEHAVPMIGAHNEVHRFTDGEDLMAAAKLLARLDDLGDGEALVVWRDIF